MRERRGTPRPLTHRQVWSLDQIERVIRHEGEYILSAIALMQSRLTPGLLYDNIDGLIIERVEDFDAYRLYIGPPRPPLSEYIPKRRAF